MRIVFAGTPEPAVVALKSSLPPSMRLSRSSLGPMRAGRGHSAPQPGERAGSKHGIEVLTPSTLARHRGRRELRARLRDLLPEAIPAVAYGNLITPDLLDLPRHGWVNLHFSLLPAWRGAAPVQLRSQLTMKSRVLLRSVSMVDWTPASSWARSKRRFRQLIPQTIFHPPG